MDKTEEQVDRYLRHRGFTSVVYEPDGNVPPDFVIDGHIAVEARRLNQIEHTSGKPRGLEELMYPLISHVKGLLESFGPPHGDGESWAVFYRYRRPFEDWKTLGPKIKSCLGDFLQGDRTTPREIRVATNFSVKLAQAGVTHSQRFWLGGFIDFDSGGWVVHEVIENAKRCIADKTAKIAAFRPRYPEWWLVLVDHIGFALPGDIDRQQFLALPPFTHTWNRVILLSPFDHTIALEMP